MQQKPKKAVRNDISASTNTHVQAIIATVPEIRIKCKLAQLLEERGISKSDFARLTGFSPNAIGAFCNNNFREYKLGYVYIYTFMITLRLTSISELMWVDIPAEIQEDFRTQSQLWKESKHMPLSVQSLFNVQLPDQNS